MNTKDAMKCMTIYREVAANGYSVVINGDDFWIGPENERLRKIVDAGEEPEMLAGPFSELEQLDAWMEGYIAGLPGKPMAPKGVGVRGAPKNINIKPANAKQGAN